MVKFLGKDWFQELRAKRLLQEQMFLQIPFKIIEKRREYDPDLLFADLFSESLYACDSPEGVYSFSFPFLSPFR